MMPQPPLSQCPAPSATPYSHQILAIALPSIVSNVTVPLLGLADVAIVGHMGSPVYIGAVAVGSMIFNLVYWLFGFLRMATSGTTAQAYGRGDATAPILARACMTALAIALLLIVLQVPLRWLMFWLIGPTADVAPLARTYFSIVIWGAPASLTLFALTGWFIGMQNTRTPMAVSILQNVVNIVASLTLVYGLSLKIEGVAWGTVIAQYAALAVALKSLPRSLSVSRRVVATSVAHLCGRIAASLHGIMAGGRFDALCHSLSQLSSISLQLFLRTLCLVAVNLYFTSAGARQGAVILSVNTVMLQLYLFFSYFMDGFANAGEALCGRYYGARSQSDLRHTLHALFRWAAAVTTVFTLTYVLGGTTVVGLLTDDPLVRQTAGNYIFWAWMVPMAGAAAFIWDGVFVGLTAARGMLVASVVAALLFFVIFTTAQYVVPPSLLNHALWLAQVVNLAARGLVQTCWYRRQSNF